MAKILTQLPAIANFDVQGHRGARGLRPENTLPGFAHAIELGVTTLELDTGLSADGVLMVCHDPVLNPTLCLDRSGRRLSGQPSLRLKDLRVEELQQFDCGSLNPDPQRFPLQQAVPGAWIPTLQQVFDLAERLNPQIRYNIESKVSPLQPELTASPEAFAATLVAIVEQNKLVDRVTIQSFDWRVLQRVKQLNPQIQTSALVLHNATTSTLDYAASPSPFLAGWNYHKFRGHLPELLRATGFIDIYSPNWETLGPGSSVFLQSVAAVQAAGFPVIAWTVNDVDTMRQLIELGVNGLITDRPDTLLNLLANF